MEAKAKRECIHEKLERRKKEKEERRRKDIRRMCRLNRCMKR